MGELGGNSGTDGTNPGFFRDRIVELGKRPVWPHVTPHVTHNLVILSEAKDLLLACDTTNPDIFSTTAIVRVPRPSSAWAGLFLDPRQANWILG